MTEMENLSKGSREKRAKESKRTARVGAERKHGG
jgi:hypothetical protein